MNTPQELQRIFDRLPKEKVELEKVELGIADDVSTKLKQVKQELSNLKNIEKQLIAGKNEFIGLQKKMLKMEDSAKNKAEKAEKLSSSAQTLIDKAYKAANDLGVKPSDIKGVKELEDLSIDLELKSVDIDDFKFDSN
tara:strand:+ start:333 stop:746 length:414 start_codon:yes stop_codon:yes gene_type:complete